MRVLKIIAVAAAAALGALAIASPAAAQATGSWGYTQRFSDGTENYGVATLESDGSMRFISPRSNAPQVGTWSMSGSTLTIQSPVTYENGTFVLQFDCTRRGSGWTCPTYFQNDPGGTTGTTELRPVESRLTGNWDISVEWSDGQDAAVTWTLNPNGTFTSSGGSAGTWANDGNKFYAHFTDGAACFYSGTWRGNAGSGEIPASDTCFGGTYTMARAGSGGTSVAQRLVGDWSFTQDWSEGTHNTGTVTFGADGSVLFINPDVPTPQAGTWTVAGSHLTIRSPVHYDNGTFILVFQCDASGAHNVTCNGQFEEDRQTNDVTGTMTLTR